MRGDLTFGFPQKHKNNKDCWRIFPSGSMTPGYNLFPTKRDKSYLRKGMTMKLYQKNTSHLWVGSKSTVRRFAIVQGGMKL